MDAENSIPGLDADAFRAALSLWASGVAVVAVRDDSRVLATTVSAFMSVSLEPPLVLVSLGPGAQVLPFLTERRRFGVSILGEAQARVASVLSDSFPVGPSHFASAGDPVIPDALVRLACRVQRCDAAGDHVLVLALVLAATVDRGDPLLRYSRGYRRLAVEGNG